MNRFDIRVIEWEDPGDARGAELRATWARLQIDVGNATLTRLIDTDASSVRDAIYLPAYPIAEWIAYNWWFLLYEPHSPQKERDYAQRHSLRTAGDGYALPDIQIKPMGKIVELSCRGRSVDGSRIEFIGNSLLHLPTQTVVDGLSRFVELVRRRLRDEGVPLTPLDEEWERITAVRQQKEVLPFIHFCAAVGQDPFDLDERTARQLELLENRYPYETALAASRAISGDIGRALSWLSVAEIEIEASSPWVELLELRHALGSSFKSRISKELPWIAGYYAAGRLRKHLDLANEPIPDLEAIFLNGSGLSKAAFTVRSPSRDIQIDSMVRQSLDGKPQFLTTKQQATAQRFALCRAVYEYLTSSERNLLLATTSHYDRQQANRAFAAEFLAPAAAIRGLTRRRTPLDEDVIEGAAQHFGVSTWVLRHQIENHGI